MLKDVQWNQTHSELLALLELLRDGGRTVEELAAELSGRGYPVSVGEVADAITRLSGPGVDRPTVPGRDGV